MEKRRCKKEIRASFKLAEPQLFFEVKKNSGRKIVAVLRITTEKEE